MEEEKIFYNVIIWFVDDNNEEKCINILKEFILQDPIKQNKKGNVFSVIYEIDWFDSIIYRKIISAKELSKKLYIKGYSYNTVIVTNKTQQIIGLFPSQEDS